MMGLKCYKCEYRVVVDDCQDCCKSEEVLSITLSEKDKIGRELLGRFHIPILPIAQKYCSRCK